MARGWTKKGGRKKTFAMVGAGVLIVIVALGAIFMFGGGGVSGESVVSLTPSTTSPKVGNTVIFTGTSTEEAISWNWDFGDGTTSTEQNPIHQYDATGTYTVKLTVTFAGGVTKTATQQITVIEVVLPTDAYWVYNDAGLVGGEPADVSVWSGGDWAGGDPPTLTDGNYVVSDAPEGTACFAVTSGASAGNYVGWGVFLGIFDPTHECITPHTVDLSGYENLEFWVKTSVDLKVDLQQDNTDGLKTAARHISDYGWDSDHPTNWQKITIPRTAFTNVSFDRIFCPFMITGVGSEITYYVDAVAWVPPS